MKDARPVTGHFSLRVRAKVLRCKTYQRMGLGFLNGFSIKALKINAVDNALTHKKVAGVRRALPA